MIGIQQLNLENRERCRAVLDGPQTKDSITVAVEGNIGSGKSTFLQYFKKFPEVEVLPEPVNKWKDVQGFNTLDLMYKDASRWSLAFQSYVQLTMAEGHKKSKSKSVKMMERSLYSARNCFVENLYKGGLMPEVDYAILSEFYGWITTNEDTNVDLIVYLRADPEVCQSRIRLRNRQEEQGVPMEYLKSLHALHEDWLIDENKFKLPAPLLVIDANSDISQLYTKFEEAKEQIFAKLS
ncbi:thymidine kinase 2, mitochondrial-like [Mizuhopecten yessoensis]|uniref:Thymidine kinase 2, mitochondrial n=1 Tax=Mizuhopecten yessoensis TaxID=6573 RepID=A0A210PXM8_MIZYE|nr:thymidine kinase 2, mitochondrial-like [Mizuhopecten yessoensis]OWF41235.1 Thymidine kinase 2, mitochondrial [Mizuhopecten yessoensis]